MTEGFKQTEVGYIPADWHIFRISEIADILTGSTPSIANKSNYGGEFMFVTPADLGRTRFILHTERKLSALGFLQARKFPANSILYTCIGSTIGKSGIAVKPLTSNQQINAIIPNNTYNSDYLYYILSFYSEKIKQSAGETAVPIINKTDFGEIKIPLPPTKTEQTAIATALSDADALITSLERLIAKKKAIKQGAIQELLTPNAGWSTKKLQDVCWFQEGPGLRNWQFTTRGIKVINVTNLENGILNLDKTDRHISLDEFNKMYRHFEIDENDIVIASSGNSYGKVAVVRKQDIPLLMNTSVIRFKALGLINYNYLLIFLKSLEFKRQIDLLITGGAQPNFGPAHLKKIIINIPNHLAEQETISTIISNMELEISALERKLDKYRQIKSGMMQVLLTGKVRLL